MENFIKKVNSILQDRFAFDAQIYGIAEPLILREEEDSMLPVINVDGECYSVLHDDIKNLTSYHRLVSKSYEFAANGFGDSKTVRELYNFNLIVIGSREEYDQYEMESLFARTLIDCEDKYNVVHVTQSTFDAQSIFASEYTGIQSILPLNLFCFKISYKLTQVQSPCKKTLEL